MLRKEKWFGKSNVTFQNSGSFPVSINRQITNQILSCNKFFWHWHFCVLQSHSFFHFKWMDFRFDGNWWRPSDAKIKLSIVILSHHQQYHMIIYAIRMLLEEYWKNNICTFTSNFYCCVVLCSLLPLVIYIHFYFHRNCSSSGFFSSPISDIYFLTSIHDDLWSWIFFSLCTVCCSIPFRFLALNVHHFFHFDSFDIFFYCFVRVSISIQAIVVIAILLHKKI